MKNRTWWKSLVQNPRFQVLRPLGDGTTSVVLECVDKFSGTIVSVKIFNPVYPDIGHTVDVAVQVVSKLESVRSPLFCNVLEVTKIHGLTAFIQENIAAEPLSGLLGQSTHTTDEWLQLFLGILKGLHILHSAGVIHGNLIPGNILVTPDFEPLLMDIGIVPRCVQLSPPHDKTLFGSLDVMAPEYLDGAPLTVQGDIYAIGWLLWRMLTGKDPFSGKTPDAKHEMHRTGQPESPRLYNQSIQEALSRITMKCLEKSPGARYDSVSRLMSDISVLYLGKKLVTDRLKRKRVLIVDDEESIRDLFHHMFDMLGMMVDVAATGHEGVEKALKLQPDLICLDIMMPDLSGLEVADILIGNPMTACIPIVFITARNDHDYMVYGRSIGIRDYLVKPISFDDIESRISYWLQPLKKKQYCSSGDSGSGDRR